MVITVSSPLWFCSWPLRIRAAVYVVTPIPETPNTGFSFLGWFSGGQAKEELTVSEEEQDVPGNVGVELPVQDQLKGLLGLGPPELWVLLLNYTCAVKRNVPSFKREDQNARTRVEV